MGSSKKILIIALVGALALTSCAKRKEIKQESKIVIPPQREEVTPPQESAPTEGPVVVFESDSTKNRVDTLNVYPGEQNSHRNVENPQTGEVKRVMGYRVQILATLKKENAERVAENARRALAKPVYIEYIPPFYKVRVGDFKNRRDAEEYKVYLRANGYPDAFVVETEIKVH